MAQLMHTSMRRNSVTEQRLRAALCAQQKLEEVRAWASAPDNFEGPWTLYDNQVFTDSDFPGFQTRTTASVSTLMSPTSQWETESLLPEQRLLPEACRVVSVECWWGAGPRDRVELTTLVGAPSRAFHPTAPLVVQEPSVSLPRDATQAFTVRAFDDNNQEIKGLTFHWFVLSKGGNAVRVSQSRDGRTATIGHWTINPLDGTKVYVSGDCEFSVTATYNGVSATGSVGVNLQ